MYWWKRKEEEISFFDFSKDSGNKLKIVLKLYFITKIIFNVIYLKLPVSKIDIWKQNNWTHIKNRENCFFFIKKIEFINAHFVETWVAFILIIESKSNKIFNIYISYEYKINLVNKQTR